MRELKAGVCPRCGNSLDAEAVDGLCPECLLDPSWNADLAAAPPPSSADASQVGPYKLLELVGEGGFGSVYAAEQENPVRRKVAVKIIKPGMDTRRVVARFEAERQALALMDHPNIARVLDAGATDAGRPYFAMEWVQGVPLTRYCEENKLSTRQRLELFVPVCRAVQHAHQKGIIHRDLKPSNVLVTTTDGRPVPKVIDFGIAKAIQGPLAPGLALTESRQFLGTPQYMSPEQADARATDVDTRSDVYSLGVLLYELLTGTTPITERELRKKTPEQVGQLLRESDPPRPSARMEELAGQDKTTSKRLARVLRGELDWVVMKCLEKDRARRYDSAGSLADDLERCLAGLPVTAGPPSRVYRMRTFVRRHRQAFAALFVLAAALLLGLGGTTYGLVRARSERNDAVRSLAQSEAVSGFFGRMMRGVSPYEGRGNDFTVRQALDDAARYVERGALKDQPYSEATVRIMIADAYLSIGMNASAGPHARAAVDHLHRLGRGDSDLLAQAMVVLAEYERRAGNFHAASQNAEASLAMYLRLHGPDHLSLARPLETIAQLCLDRYDPGAAVPHYRRALDLRRKDQGANHPDFAATLYSLGDSLRAQGAFPEAEQALAEALSVRTKALGEEELGASEYLEGLAIVVRRRGDKDRAVELLRRSLAVAAKGLPPSHPFVASRQKVLARFLEERMAPGDLEDAQGLFEAALTSLRRALPADDPQVTYLMARIARIRHYRGDAGGARQAAKAAIDLDLHRYDRLLGETPGAGQLYFARAHTHARTGDFDKALHDYDEAIDRDPMRHEWHNNRAIMRLYVGRVAEYQADCRHLLRQFGDTQDPQMAERSAKVCLLHPPPPEDLVLLTRMVDVAVRSKSRPGLEPWFKLVKGMGEHRAGRHADALKWFEESQPERFPPRVRALLEAFRAMAHHALGHTEEAHDALLLAREKIALAACEPGINDLDPEGPASGILEDHLQALIVVREAEEVVGPQPTPHSDCSGT